MYFSIFMRIEGTLTALYFGL